MRYPDYVKQFRPKGTIVKRVNDTYYAYYATSKRVPDKKYPVQIIKGLAGRIVPQIVYCLCAETILLHQLVSRDVFSVHCLTY